MTRPAIQVEELSPRTRKALGIRQPREPKPVPARIVALGEILSCVKGLSRREALWAIRKACETLGGDMITENRGGARSGSGPKRRNE